MSNNHATNEQQPVLLYREEAESLRQDVYDVMIMVSVISHLYENEAQNRRPPGVCLEDVIGLTERMANKAYQGIITPVYETNAGKRLLTDHSSGVKVAENARP